MLRLGHIEYSNCVPVHALLLEQAADPAGAGAPRSPAADIVLVRDVPSSLNRALAAGRIDVAPCSSIEYARHADEYRILPDFAIGSDGPVQSILLESLVPLAQLGGRVVAIPTASATSIVLLRALLELRLGTTPELRWYDQAAPGDPLEQGAAAALRIGDVALTRGACPGRSTFDLGAEWCDWTGLPFAYAVWQVRRDADPAAVQRLIGQLRESRAWFTAHADRLADRYAAQFGLPPARLLAYWTSLRYELSPRMQEGLLHFYRLASELGEAPATTTLDIVPSSG
jgi:chorismate dehydratase